ncbi:apolipoprotein N-acyltransferase [Idiomarina xiamenensis]|uniref:Apolipoprotein N-acyltransferase n=1 Tax=Idiomarina xiamenensis 10-D-4 TaxID=740709 RepID=K2KJN2_9GAMM|nr:apolipoprotein N-acyltransferase [Idiomarina xiamenensis]EKE82799.1 apolipoprotein N-acyltransferase [Idiomarina xiamenensis 10-D-4]
MSQWLRRSCRFVAQHGTLRVLLALLSGAALSLAYAPFGHAYLAFIIPPLLIALAWYCSPRSGWRLGYAFGFGWFAAGLSWIYVSIDQYGGMPEFATVGILLLLFAYLAIFPALAFCCWRVFAKRHAAAVFLLPTFWLAFELLRGWLFTGFPWLGLGYTQTDTQFGTLAPLLGEQGLAVLIWLAAASVVYGLTQRRYGWLAIAISIAISPWLTSFYQPIQSTGESKQVSLVQGNIKQSLKWQSDQQWPSLLRYLDLSRPHYDNDLVVWPESAITALEPFAGDVLHNIDQAAQNSQTSIVSGIIDYDRDHDAFFNSIIVLGNSHTDSEQNGYRYGSSNRYLKHQLLPIGEFVPFEEWLRPLAPLFNLPMSSFSRGDFVQPNLVANNIHLAAAICYEIAFPEQVRAGVRADTDYLLTISNDTWFGDSHGPWQHMQIARMRAIEMGRPLLRATNNGVSAIVDAQGKTLATAPQFEAAVISAEVPLVSGETLYHRYGLLIPLLLAALSTLFSLLAWRQSTTKKQKADAGQ